MSTKKPSKLLQHDWDYFYKNHGKEFEIEGDRNNKRLACAQYFKRQGKNVKVYSRMINGKPHLMVVKVGAN